MSCQISEVQNNMYSYYSTCVICFIQVAVRDTKTFTVFAHFFQMSYIWVNVVLPGAG